MKILFVISLFVVLCTGNHLKIRQLIDLLRAQEADEFRRHEVTVDAKRHPVTVTAQSKRHQVTAAAKRHQVSAAAKRHTVTAAVKRQNILPIFTEAPVFDIPTTPKKDYIIVPEEDEFFSYKEAFLFPGSHYLIDMIRHHCESGMGLKIAIEDIKDDFEIPECEMKKIGNVLELFRLVPDPDSVALLVTRMMIKPMLDERMKCPATILDMGFIKLLLAKKEEFVADDDAALYPIFKEIVPLVDAALEPYADDIATMLALEVHGHIFNETMEFLWKYGLKDLAYASHSIYHGLVMYFQTFVNGHHTTAIANEIKLQIESGLSEIKCPSSSDVVEYHKKAMQRLKDVFVTTETETICLELTGALTNYIHMSIPGYQLNFEDNSPLDTICDNIKQIIDGIVREYSEYESFLYSMNLNELETITENIFTDGEWAVLAEALRRLDFVRIH